MATSLTITGIEELRALAGTEALVSGDLEVPQYGINSFAQLTRDYNPIHLDQAYCRSGAGLPGITTTIAHGMLIASLAVGIMQSRLEMPGWDVYLVRLNDVQFMKPVPSNSTVRVKVAIGPADQIRYRERLGNIKFVVECTVVLVEPGESPVDVVKVTAAIMAVRRATEEIQQA